MPPNEGPCAVAIVGMACVFPGASSLDAFWRNVVEGRSAISEIPLGRLDPVYFQSGAEEPNRFVCRRGGFIDEYAYFDPARFGVMPVAAERAEPDQLLTLDVAARALTDAAYPQGRALPPRTGVVLGRGGHGASGHARAEQDTRGAEQLEIALRGLFPQLPQPVLRAIKREFQAQITPPRGDGAIGMIPNLVASRIAHHFDLNGPAYTVDGACASALLALAQAISELQAGRSDLMISGGVHLCHTEAFWSVFHHLGALSRSQIIRPFDARADGLLIGEGIGVLVLKREADARRDGDRIYAVVRGVGVASDGRAQSLVSPASAGQRLALQRAWTQSQLDPDDLTLLEAHGTGTPLGDRAELETVAHFFAERSATAPRSPVLGSVKSMIGHTMAAAGAAGLIKAALSLYHRVLPPTLNCEQPRAELASTRFRVLARAEGWERQREIAAVSSFGFGGINAHAVLTGVSGTKVSRSERSGVRISPRLELFAADTADGLLRALELRQPAQTGAHRLAMIDADAARIERARAMIRRGVRVQSESLGIYYSPDPLLSRGGKLACVFPGVSHEHAQELSGLLSHFGLPFSPREEAGEVGHGLRVLEENQALFHALVAVGVRADLLAGHSLGEWSAMAAGGVVDEDTRGRFIQSFDVAIEAPRLASAALFCGYTQARAALDGLPGVEISHDHCPRQVVVCGDLRSIEHVTERLRGQNILVRPLAFSTGVHTSNFAGRLPAFERLGREVRFYRPDRPVYSGVLCAPYPEDAASIRQLATGMLLEPVRLRELIGRLYADGARVFVQVGTGPVAGFVRDTLAGRAHLAVSSASGKRPALLQLIATACALWAEGAAPDWSKLPVELIAGPVGMKLSLGVSLARFSPLGGTRHALGPEAPARDGRHVADPSDVVAEADSLLSRLAHVRAAFDAQLGSPVPKSPARIPRAASTTAVIRVSREISLEAYPELADHAFYPQAPGWSDPNDTNPVMPLTGIVQLMIDAALQAGGDRRCPVGLAHVTAHRWLQVAQPVQATFVATPSPDGAQVTLEDYAHGDVLLEDTYPEPPPAPEIPGRSRAAVPTAREIYRDRWMFHGPAYRGIEHIEGLNDRGIWGTLRCGAAIGSLLDSAAQLFGVWFMHELTSDRLAMPVRLEHARFFGPHPAPGELLSCVARPLQIEPEAVTGELFLARAGRLYAHLSGWEARRLPADEALWRVITWPEKNLLSRVSADAATFDGRYRRAMTQEYLRARYLRSAERDRLKTHPPAAQRGWLSARIAAKDALRAYLWRRGGAPMFPAELLLSDGEGVLDVLEPASCALQVRIERAGDFTTATVLPLGGDQP